MNHDNSPSALLDQLSTQQTLNFEYSFLEAETRRTVQQRTNEIKTLMRRNSQDIIDIGQKLIEVKQYLGHGNFRNWLEFEFNWSISAATKFMQVADQFKCVNFTHLNITASTLYLIAAPSTPKEARVEVLERATKGENISYTKAKVIVSQHRKTTKLKSDESVNVVETKYYKASVSLSKLEDLTDKKVHTETQWLLSEESLPFVAFENKQIATNIEDIHHHDTIQAPTSIENQVTISYHTSDTAIAEMAICIKNLTPEQLAMMIVKAANNGLSESQLSAIIIASQQVLNTTQQLEDR
ncbi:MAG: DUF3102 domain-containing protein [Rhizonema sp. PD37]|nr:DUF3102 domain-containing protein [Rhizonema sp. PD37]